MKNGITVIAGVLLVSLAASAQDTPKMETFLGFTYLRANSASNVPAFSANGGGGQFAYNFNKWLGGVADMGAVHNGNIGGYHIDSTYTNFLFGPRLSLRKWSRVTPYFNVLFGVVHAAASTRLVLPLVTLPQPVFVSGLGTVTEFPIPGNPISTRIGTSQTSFAMTTGGGLDIKLTKHMTLRPIGLDYYMTRLQNLRSQSDNNQHNLRYTTGINFTFGAQ